MPNPATNPDGTVQVAPPTQSAFGPASASAPPPPAAPAPVQAGTPEQQGAIYQLIQALAQAFAPKAVTQRKAAINQTPGLADEIAPK